MWVVIASTAVLVLLTALSGCLSEDTEGQHESAATLSKFPCIRPKAGEPPTWRVGMKWRKVCDDGGEIDRISDREM